MLVIKALLALFFSVFTGEVLNDIINTGSWPKANPVKCIASNHDQTSRKKQVPILCYHHIRDSMGTYSTAYSISTIQLRSHIQMICDSGYTVISPDRLYNYLAYDSSLPAKPIIISFDDGYLEHFTIASHILDSFNFKGFFFIPAATIGKKGLMDAKAVKALSASGHAIGSHSWNHPDLRKADSSAWALQIDSATSKLQHLTGKPVQYFAYPYGEWTDSTVVQLKKRKISAAFQLTRKQSTKEPLYTIRRVAVPGDWSADMLSKQIKSLFK